MTSDRHHHRDSVIRNDIDSLRNALSGGVSPLPAYRTGRLFSAAQMFTRFHWLAYVQPAMLNFCFF